MNKILIVGADPFPPYQYFDEEGNLKGTDYELIRRIFNLIGDEIKVYLDDWKRVEDALINKEIDAAFQVQYNKEREKKYYFSNLFRNALTEVVTGEANLELKNFYEIEVRRLTQLSHLNCPNKALI